MEENSSSKLAICQQPYPWLMLSSENQKIFYSITEKRYHLEFINDLHKKNVFFTSSNKNWLVVQDRMYRDDNEPCFLVNISTMEKVWLPPMEDLSDYPLCALSSSPKLDNACRVVFFNQFSGTFLSCYIGDTEYVDRNLTIIEEEEEEEQDVIGSVVNFDGKLYALTVNYNLYSADFSDPDLIFSPIIGGRPLYKLIPAHDEFKYYLVESSGDLLYVYTRSRDHELTDLKIHKADFIKKEWVCMENIGDTIIFLDARNGFSSPASRFGLRGNCVYFVNKRGKNVFMFDFEDESFFLSLSCPIAKSSSSLSWIYVTKY